MTLTLSPELLASLQIFQKLRGRGFLALETTKGETKRRKMMAKEVGKSLLIKCLVKHYTKHNIQEVRGPITIVSGKKRRVQFVECPNDINGMIDAAKFADLALLLIDGSYGFEMGFPFPKFNGAGRLVKYGGFPDFQLSKGFQVAVALQNPLEPNHVSSELGTPPISGLFGPIEISPSVLPRYPYPGENLAPMYPTFPTTYEPNLTGKCPVNFTAMSNVIDRTASDCSQPLAALVGNVICCPQLGSLLHIFQGYFSGNSDKLVLQNAVADDCFSDIISILASRGANITIPTLCSVKSLNLTGGLCPVKDVF
uniref:SPARK domain-containing protein n=1 Tax=Salix viminalis TaxID=40686 RepID=A0A6N2MF84_SALVM